MSETWLTYLSIRTAFFSSAEELVSVEAKADPDKEGESGIEFSTPLHPDRIRAENKKISFVFLIALVYHKGTLGLINPPKRKPPLEKLEEAFSLNRD